MVVVSIGVIAVVAVSNIFYVFAMYRARGRWQQSQKHVQALEILDTQRTTHINVLYARLSAMGHLASSGLGSDPHPYRVDPSRLADVLRRICEMSEEALTKNFRGVGHFNSLEAATMFLRTLGPGSHPYVLPIPMWDGDCYHVIYSTLPEQPPDGIKVLK